MRWGFWEIILIVILVVLLFGSAKIPGMLKNIAEGVKVFKKEMETKKEAPKHDTKKKAVKKPAKKK